MVALLNDFRLSQGKSSLGFLNPLIYAAGVSAGFNDITSGSNPGCGTNGFTAGPGWDPVSVATAARVGRARVAGPQGARTDSVSFAGHRPRQPRLRQAPSPDRVKPARGEKPGLVGPEGGCVSSNCTCKSDLTRAVCDRARHGAKEKQCSRQRCCGLPPSATHGLLRPARRARRPLSPTFLPHGVSACITPRACAPRVQRAYTRTYTSTWNTCRTHTLHTLRVMTHSLAPCVRPTPYSPYFRTRPPSLPSCF